MTIEYMNVMTDELSAIKIKPQPALVIIPQQAVSETFILQSNFNIE